MPTTIFKTYTFEAAHSLPNVCEGHKCGRLHGHSYKLTITIQGDVDTTTGFILDFGDISCKVKPIVNIVDHRYLNEIPDLENPTCENLCKWFYDKLIEELPIQSITIYETRTSGASYGR